MKAQETFRRATCRLPARPSVGQSTLVATELTRGGFYHGAPFHFPFERRQRHCARISAMADQQRLGQGDIFMICIILARERCARCPS